MIQGVIIGTQIQQRTLFYFVPNYCYRPKLDQLPMLYFSGYNVSSVPRYVTTYNNIGSHMQ